VTVPVCVSAVFAVVQCPSVRPCVCPSDTFVYCIHTAEDIVELHSRPGTGRWPHHSSFLTPSGGAKYTGVGKLCEFRLKSPFFSETVRDRQWLLWNVMWQIDVC